MKGNLGQAAHSLGKRKKDAHFLSAIRVLWTTLSLKFRKISNKLSLP